MDLLSTDRNKPSKPSPLGPSPSSVSSLPIPVYTIDLSLPPHLRYVAVATDFAPKMRSLTHLFDDILTSITPHKTTKRIIEFFASILLFRLFSAEETKELKGISKASGVKMFLLVALNVLLDSMLGCTSGGVIIAPKKGSVKGKEKEGEGDDEPRMMHFRTLDWGMDPLREVLVVLEFVRSASAEPNKVLARTVTYAGFVGVLTGVRKNLSISLNFRGQRECTIRSLRIHQLLVLFGFRPSIASVLRNIITPPSLDSSPAPPLSQITKQLETTKASPCYLVASSGDETAMLEKDLYTARTSTSDEFIVATNWDCDCEETPNAGPEPKSATIPAAMDEIIAFGDERRDMLQDRFKAVKKRQEKKWKEENVGSMEGFQVKVRESTLMGWMKIYPVWSELTHFGCIMDPKRGEIRWIERGDVEACESDVEEVEAGEGDSTTVNFRR